MSKKILLAFLISVVFTVGGCANLPVPNLVNDPYEGLSQQEIDNLKLREWSKIRVHNDKLEGYLYSVLIELFGEEKLQEHNVRVALIADQNPGATVGADGLVIWHIGNFMNLDSEDEVAAMLAHEMTHLIAGHHETTQTESAMDKFMAAGETAAVFSGAGSAVELWAAANSVRWASDSVLFPSFTREEETEADIEAARLLVNAGYNADAVRVMLGRLRAFYGEQREFVSQKMLHVTGQDSDGTTHYRVDVDAVIGNLAGLVQERWGQEYESHTQRESEVRSMLMTEYPGRKRGEFKTSTYKSVIEDTETRKWLAAHETGFEAVMIDITDDESYSEFQGLTKRMMNDPLTSEIFDYDILFNAALRNGLLDPADKIAVHLINSDVATLDHYLKVGGSKRQARDYEQAIAAYSLADQIFSSEQDEILLPLILATKDDAGIPQGNTAIRCLNPSVMMACLKRK